MSFSPEAIAPITLLTPATNTKITISTDKQPALSLVGAKELQRPDFNKPTIPIGH